MSCLKAGSDNLRIAGPADREPWGFPFQIGLQVFETLVGYDRSLRLEGRLAESWACSRDGLGYRFVLRPGARFHDGEPVTATAVRDFLAGSCLERLGVRPLVASVEAIGSRAAELRLRRPFSPLLDRLAAPAAVVHSTAGPGRRAARRTGAFGRPVVSTGAFTSRRWGTRP